IDLARQCTGELVDEEWIATGQCMHARDRRGVWLALEALAQHRGDACGLESVDPDPWATAEWTGEHARELRTGFRVAIRADDQHASRRERGSEVLGEK